MLLPQNQNKKKKKIKVELVCHLPITLHYIGYTGYRLYRYRPKYWHVLVKLPVISQNENTSIGIGSRYVGTNISLSVSQKYWLGEYIGIDWTYIDKLYPTLCYK
jgi:hypothetical protein